MSKTLSEPRHAADFVTVIIPTFNSRERLLLLLKSLENQSVKNFEVIVVDDGSTDETRETVAERVKGYHVSLSYYYLDNTNIFGAGIARNYGAKHARGDILLFLDQDCVAERDLIKKHLDHHKTKDIILGYFAGYGNEKKCYKFSRLKEYVQQKKPIIAIKEFRDRLFQKASRHDPWKCFVSAHFSIKKGLFRKFNFDEEFIQWGGQDVDLGYRLFKDGNVINFEKDCIVYNSWEGFKYTKQKVLSLSKSLIYTYKKYQTEDIKRYCLERFYHTPIKYRGFLQLILENNRFKIKEFQTTIFIEKNCNAQIVLGRDFLDVKNTVEQLIPLIKSVQFDISIVKALKGGPLSEFKKNLRQLIRILKDNNKEIGLEKKF